MSMIEPNIGMAWIEQALRYMIQEYGFEETRRKVMNKPQLWALLLQLVGDETVPDVPAPTNKLTPWRVQNNQIYFNNKLWKGMGMNMRELAFYGIGIDPIKWAKPHHIIAQLDGAAAKQCSVIRVYCAHKHIDVDQAINRLRYVLDEAQKRGLFVILVLTDGAPPSDWWVADTTDNRQDGYTWDWIRVGYRGAYWDYVDRVTKALGTHPAIWSLEPINELFAPSYPLTEAQSEAMLSFWKEITALIRKNAPTKMISTGNISCWENFVLDAYGGKQYARKLALLPTVDIMTFHSYPIRPPDPANPATAMGEAHEHIVNELKVLNGIGKVAFVLEETAQRVLPDIEMSSDPLRLQGEEILKRGIAMIMLWNVSFPYGENFGVGDGFFNGVHPPHSTRWHNSMGWFEAKARQFKELYS